MPKARKRTTCTECSLRRQQCDRRIPCGRCVKRGVPEKCQLNWPSGTYDPTTRRTYQSSRHNNGSDTILTSRSSPPRSPSLPREPTVSAGTGVALAQEDWSREISEPNRPYMPTTAYPRYVFTPFVRTRLRTTSEEASRTFQNSFLDSSLETFLQSLLPDASHIWKLVDYHEQYLLWYHCCYHGPTFRAELEGVLAEQDDTSTLRVTGLRLQWLALLFSIMTGSLTCTIERRLSDWGFSRSETDNLSLQWYKCTILCLNHGEWTSDHTMYSVKAVTTLTMSAHALGRSAELTVLLGSALKIACALGLDRLRYDANVENIDEVSTSEQRQQMLDRDVGRKVWSQLCVQDWMSAAFVGSHNIHSLHFTSIRPSSRNHLTMEPIPETFPTYVSYGNYILEIARLIMQHHNDALQSTTPFTKYNHVVEYGVRMRELATKDMPRYFHVIEPIDATWPEWIRWARSSLTIYFSHSIIMIHRDYISRSFTNPAYSKTKTTCVAAAKTILNEVKKAQDSDGPIIWIDRAFCVMAALILCLDLAHRRSSDPDYPNHLDLVLVCIRQLERSPSSVIASRGARLLNDVLTRGRSILTEHPYGEDPMEFIRLISESDNPAQSLQDKTDLSAELFPPPTGFSNVFLFKNLFVPGDLNS